MLQDDQVTVALHVPRDGRYLIRPNGSVRYFVEGTNQGRNWSSIEEFDEQKSALLILAIALIDRPEWITLLEFERPQVFRSLNEAFNYAKAVAWCYGYSV